MISQRRIDVVNMRCKVRLLRSITRIVAVVVRPKMVNCTSMPGDDCA